jgi:hypothetical protein
VGGIGLLGLAFVLYLTSGVMLRRRAASAGPVRAPAAPRAAGEEAGPAAKRSIEERQTPGADPDLADIEDILRRRGIS